MRWPRHTGESDDAYFMRVLGLARTRYPDLQEYELWCGVCDETNLPCLHPWNIREYQSFFDGVILLKDFIASEPPRHMENNPDYQQRVLEMTRCPVCDTWNPTDPVDIRKKRGRMLGLALAIAMRLWNDEHEPSRQTQAENPGPAE